MEQIPQIITGGKHVDHQGQLSFINDFDMAPIKRTYRITQLDTSVTRGWRGHQIEQRWFYVSRGVFKINLVKIDNWDKPDTGLKQTTFTLTADNNCVLHIPKGYATAIRALQPNSELTIFADHYIEDAKNDDHLFPINYFGPIE